MDKKIGIYICECGPNIAENVNIDRIIETISAIDDFADTEFIVKRYGLLCSVQGKEYLEQEIKENELTHLVVAACSPRDHDSTFIGVCKKTDLNPYLYKMINIREHCAWIIHDKEEATDKAIQYIKGGIHRVIYQSELVEKKIDSIPDVAVIGGGITGMEAALAMAGDDRKVLLVEKADQLGGHASRLKALLPGQVSPSYITDKIEAIKNNPNISVFTNSRLESAIGFLGNFEIVVADNSSGEKRDFTVGGVVLATGFTLKDHAAIKNYSWKKDDQVYTALQAEQMLGEDKGLAAADGSPPKSVALVHCSGRSEAGYCSGVCCRYLLHIAGRIKSMYPDCDVTEFHQDLCLPHKNDQKLYADTSAQGVVFKRILSAGIKGMTVVYETMAGKKAEQTADIIITSPPMEPSEGTKELADMLGISLSENGFFQEAHHSINPEATTTDGIYIAGCAHGPKGISDSVLQAHAAAGRIFTLLIPGQKIVPEVKVSEVLEAFCMGCKTCLDVCSYGCINFDPIKGVSVVNEAVCRGCGNCVGSCPSGAIRLKHFTASQLYQEVFEALK